MGEHGWESELGVVREKKSINGENGGPGEVVQLPTLKEGEKNGGAKWEAWKVGKKKRNKIKK